MTTIIFVGNGSITYTPASTVTATVECWGAGQAGNNGNGNGGEAGGYAKKNALALTKGTGVSLSLGAPGTTDAQAGADTWASSSATVLARGGGSATVTQVGDVTNLGGAFGLFGATGTNPAVGGGGGAGGPNAAGSAGGNGGTDNVGSGGGGGGASNGGGIGSNGGTNVGGNGGGTTGGVGATTAGSPNGGAGGPGSGGGGGFSDGTTQGAGGAGGDDYNNGGGGAGGGGNGASTVNTPGANGGTPGGGGVAPTGTGTTIGRGGYGLVKITYPGGDPDQIIFGGSITAAAVKANIPSTWNGVYTTSAYTNTWTALTSGVAGDILPASVTMSGPTRRGKAPGIVGKGRIQLRALRDYTVPSTATLWSGSATFAGTGSFAATAVELEIATTTLAGAGSLAATAVELEIGTTTFAGAGNLSVDTVHTPLGAATFAGAGNLSATAVEVELATTAFAGAGALTVPAVELEIASTTLAGAGNLSATAVEREIATATFAGAGALTAPAAELEVATTLLAGAGGLNGSAAELVVATATFAGAGALTASAVEIEIARATFAGTGALSANATHTPVGAVAFAGAGNLASTAVELEIATTLFAGSGALNVDASAPGQVNAAFAGAGGLTVNAVLHEVASTAFAGNGALFVNAVHTPQATARFAGAGALIASAVERALATTTFAGAGLLSVNPTRTTAGTAVLAGAGRVTVSGVARELGTTILAGSGGFAADLAVPPIPASATFAGTGEMYVWSRGTPATYFDATGALQTAPVDARREGYDPVTLAFLGAIDEDFAINYIRNNTMQGAVAGTPGTAPTNWTVPTAGGWTVSIIGTGVESGISYIDIEFSTASATQANEVISFEPGGIIDASPGDVWTESVFLAVIGGSLTGVSSVHLTQSEKTAAGGQLQFDSGPNVKNSLTGTLQPFAFTTTLTNASTGGVQPQLFVATTFGGAFDVTLRIGMPQMELGGAATSVIATSGNIGIRAPDIAVPVVLAVASAEVDGVGALAVDTVHMPTATAVLAGSGALNTLLRNSDAWYFDSTGTLQDAPPNVPRYGYDPVTLTPLGLLVEAASSNGVRNPRAEGANVGANTMPTYWSANATNGIARTVIGNGTEDGVPYIDIRFNGTPTSTLPNASLIAFFESTTQIAAAQGQQWTNSVFMRVAAGDLTNVSALRLIVREDLVTGPGTGTSHTLTVTVPTTGTLRSARLTQPFAVTNANTAFLVPQLVASYTAGLPIDFTLRIGAPQLEQQAVATSVMLPPVGSPGVSTREADIIPAVLEVAAATLPGSGGLTADTGAVALASALMAGSGAQSATVSLTAAARGALAGAGVLQASAAGRLSALVRLIGGGGILVAPTARLLGKAEVDGSGVVEVSFAATLHSSASFGGTASMRVDGTRLARVPPNLNAIGQPATPTQGTKPASPAEPNPAVTPGQTTKPAADRGIMPAARPTKPYGDAQR